MWKWASSACYGDTRGMIKLCAQFRICHGIKTFNKKLKLMKKCFIELSDKSLKELKENWDKEYFNLVNKI